MKLHEYQARDVFARYGIPLPEGQPAYHLQEAKTIANNLTYPVVLKAQVLVGGRGKAGGVKVVQNEPELIQEFDRIKNLTIKGHLVEKLLVAKVVHIKKEFYAATAIDNIKGDVVLILSSQGGMDIEETAKNFPERIYKYYLNGARNLEKSQSVKVAQEVFGADLKSQAADILEKLVSLFFQIDCSLAEINPLVIDERGQLIAADAKIIIDDNALYRQKEAKQLQDLKYEDPDELEAKEKGLSFVKLEGHVGCIVNGAGLAMATMDTVKLLGGKPANFLDVGGSSNPQKVLNALKIILRNSDIKVILINIFGGITRCDDIAAGILAALEQIKMPVPLVIRLTGTNEALAKEMLAKAGINTFSSMRQAVIEAVKLSQSVSLRGTSGARDEAI